MPLLVIFRYFINFVFQAAAASLSRLTPNAKPRSIMMSLFELQVVTVQIYSLLVDVNLLSLDLVDEP